MIDKEDETIMGLQNENKELKFRVEELRKSFLSLKIEMDIQQDHLKRVVELNKLMVPKLDVENIANSFFTYLNGVLGFDQCGIVVYDERYIFLNNLENKKLELQTKKDSNSDKIINFLYNKIKEKLKPIILAKEHLELLTKHQIKSLIAFPLIQDKKVLGMILLESKKEDVYTENELILIEELIGSMPEIIEHAVQFSEITEIANRDPLTELYNKEFFDNETATKFVEKNKDFSIIFIDIHNFKKINSTYGSHTGNVILKDLGKILKLFSHEKYTVARYEGGKFSILLPHFDLKETEAVANKIKNYLLEKDILKLTISYSFGISHFSKDSKLTYEEVLENADNALSSSKLLGVNKIISFKTEL